jgi:hypothetical protein
LRPSVQALKRLKLYQDRGNRKDAGKNKQTKQLNLSSKAQKKKKRKKEKKNTATVLLIYCTKKKRKIRTHFKGILVWSLNHRSHFKGRRGRIKKT